MKLNALWRTELDRAANSLFCWDLFSGCSILITGATGLIGSYLIRMILQHNKSMLNPISVYGLGRNKESAKDIFGEYWDDPYFVFLKQDVCSPLPNGKFYDYIIHAASNAYPQLLADHPVDTMLGNFIGMQNLLDFARVHGVKKVLFVSSSEVYGLNTNSLDLFSEDSCGYVDNMNFRSGYPNSKRSAETLCAAYTKQYGINTVVARPCYCYGPTMKLEDNRATAQFIRCAIESENIVLKSYGTQVRSHCYVGDCACALLFLLAYGQPSEAYNIAHPQSAVAIRQFAETVAEIGKIKVELDVHPSNNGPEATKPVRVVLDTSKLTALGWRAGIDLFTGVGITLNILR